MHERVIGILGGMGPLASLELYRLLIARVPAQRDQEHPRVVIDSNSKVPDRTEAALHGGEDPGPALVESARLLERAGAEVIGIPCNTAHLHYDLVADSVGVQVVHMLREAAGTVDPALAPVGILASDATAALGLYQEAFGALGLDTLVPSPSAQRAAMTSIKHVKAGRLEAALPDARAAVADLAGLGARSVVLGCTEFSVLLPGHDVALPQIDPLTVLADTVLRLALPGWTPPDRAHDDPGATP